MTNKFDTIHNFLQSLNHKFSIISLCETWLRDSDDLNIIQIPNYNLIHKDRSIRRGGGVALYLSTNIAYRSRDELSLLLTSAESLFIEIELDCGRNIICGSIYRPPDENQTLFDEELSHIMQIISREKKKAYLVGDYNINLLKYSESRCIQDHVDSIYANSFQPVITKPTRITDKTVSLIDNIYCNIESLMPSIKSGILPIDISDHFPVFCINTAHQFQHPVQKCIYQRKYTPNQTHAFIDDLQNNEWLNVVNTDDVNTAYNNFTSTLNACINRHFPLQKVRIRANTTQSPWITLGIVKAIIIIIIIKLHLYSALWITDPSRRNH